MSPTLKPRPPVALMTCQSDLRAQTNKPTGSERGAAHLGPPTDRRTGASAEVTVHLDGNNNKLKSP